MTEYIERKAVVEMLENAQIISDGYYGYCGYCIEDVNIDAIPTADVAPVVRCKDCKHNHWELEPCHGKTIHYCNAFGFKIDITDALHEFFCGYGERRSE